MIVQWHSLPTMDNMAGDILQQIQPLCVSVAKEPCSKNIIALRDHVTSCNTSGKDLQLLLEYIIFPLQITIKRKNVTRELKLQALSCIRILLSRIVLKNVDIFKEVFQNICLILSCKEIGKLSDVTEDDKEELLDCLLILLNKSNEAVLKEMYHDIFMPSLGHCISLLLSICEQEKSKTLIVKATKCIEHIANPFLNGSTCYGDKYEIILSQKLASFLPGISISLGKVIFSGGQLSKNVIIGALDAWVSHIRIVMNDKYSPETDKSPEGLIGRISQLTTNDHIKNEQDNNTKRDAGLLVQKDLRWYQNTASKLKILIDNLPELVVNPNWKVHIAILDFSATLLETCSKTLSNCIPCLFEVVMGFLSNDYPQVALKSKSIMEKIQIILDESKTTLVEVVERSLYSYFTRIPREIRSTDETKKLQLLHVIVGYLQILGPNLSTVLNSSHFLKRVSGALIQILQFDLTDVKIVEEKATLHVNENVLLDNKKDQLWQRSPINRKHFKYFRDEKIAATVCQICVLLAHSGQLMLIIDHLLDTFRSTPTSRKEIAFLVNEIIRGVLPDKLEPKGDCQQLSSCIFLIITEYVSPSSWNISISNTKTFLTSDSSNDDVYMVTNKKGLQNSLSFAELNSNVQLSCMVLEGIAIFASKLDHLFEPMLLDVLYPIMEKLGCGNAIISQSAHFCLMLISVSCGYNSIEELLQKNVDYLINSISLNLRRLHLHADTPTVFNALMQCGSQDLLPYLEDCLDELLNLIDSVAPEFLWSLSKAMNSIVCAINRWYDNKDNSNGEKTEKVDSKQDVALKDYFVNLLQLKQSSLDEIKDETEYSSEHSVNDVDKMVDEEKEHGKEIPLHIKFTERIVEKCAQFINSRYVEIRLNMLDTTEHCVLALASEENRLLPIIHKLWHAIVQCLSDKEIVVRIRTVSLIRTMVDCSGQFMRRRVIKDVLPLLTTYLRRQQSIDIKSAPLYHHTQTFKLQVVILDTLGHLCCCLDICDIDLNHVILSILPYLSERHPPQLQQTSVNSVKKIIDLDPDMIWLALQDLYCPQIPSLPSKCPSEMFPIINFACGDCDKDLYAKNVNFLLNYCDSIFLYLHK